MPGGANPQMQVPQNNENAIIFNNVVKALQAQPPFTGWKAEVQLRDRAVRVFKM